MKFNWPLLPIGEVAQIFDGPHATPKKSNSGPIFLGISSLDNGRLDLSEKEHLLEEDFTKWTRRVLPQADDVVFSYETRIGQAAIIPQGLRCCLGRRLALIRVDKKRLDPKFLLYQYLSPSYQEFLRSRTVPGSTVDRISLKEFPSFTISVPPLQEQRQIAAILSSLDDKIELNRRMNRTLEQLAQTLFRQWFVAFDFPDAEGKPYRSSGGELMNSELGKIPKGWRVERLSEVAGVNAKTLNPKKASGSIRYIDIASVSTGKVEQVTELLFEEAPSRARRIIKDGDIVWSTVRPNRRAFFLALNVEPNTIASTGFAVLSADEVPFSFLYLLTTTEEFTSYLVNNATGSTYPAVNSSVFASAKLIVPEEVILRHFHTIVAPLLMRINQNDVQSRTLATLRDTLLPQLLSGRLTVRQAEELVA